MKRKIRQYITTWQKRGYPDGLPNEAPARLEQLCKAPSYRAICRAILRNDVTASSLGFTKEHSEAYMLLKRIEIEARR